MKNGEKQRKPEIGNIGILDEVSPVHVVKARLISQWRDFLKETFKLILIN